MEKNKQVVKKNDVIKKPNPVLYLGAGIFFKIYNRLKYGLTITGEKAKGPALVLSNHTSNQDWKFVATAHWPRRINFVATYHWFTFKNLNFWLRTMGAIPKYQFATDMASMKRIRYVLTHNKGMVYIAPEGTVYAEGNLGYISPSIAKTIKIFGVDVYASKIQGAGLGNAKWSTSSHKGKVNIDTHLIITKEETKTLTIEEIMERINSSLSYDEFAFQKEKNISVLGDDKLEGFDTMFYKCPKCGKEFTIKSAGNEVYCTNCGAKAVLGNDFRFTWEGDKQFFDNYTQWYDWQLEEVKKEIAEPNYKMEEEVEYAIDEPGVNNYIKVGKGTITLTHSGWDYRGTKNGEYVEEHDELEDVFLATLKIGKHFELPFKNGHCRVYYPIANGKTSMKWHLASRAMTEYIMEEKRKAKEKLTEQ